MPSCRYADRVRRQYAADGTGEDADVRAHLDAGCSVCLALASELVRRGLSGFAVLAAGGPGLAVPHVPPEGARPVGPGSTGEPDAAPPGYEILGELGRGGMGVVYRARQVRLNREVALKMVSARYRGDPAGLRRFLAEAEAAAAVRHPNVVEVYECGEASGSPYLAMEYLSGGTLAGRLAASRPAPYEAAALVLKVALGVAAAHDAGVVHRDLKPANVLFDGRGEPKVADFGLAKRDTGAGLTRSDAVLGTLPYMAPEQIRRPKAAGPAADVWSLGVVLYECLTGARPFGEDDLLAAVDEAPPPPRSRVPGVPRDLELICLTCLAKGPHDRYPTAAELADDLGRFLGGRPIGVRPTGPIRRAIKLAGRNPAVASLIGLTVLSLVVGSAVSIHYGLQSAHDADQANRLGGIAKERATAADREAGRAWQEERRAREAEKQAGIHAATVKAQATETRRLLDLSRQREAQTAWGGGRGHVARKFLAEVAPENRGLAWGVLDCQYKPGLFTLHAHATAVAVSGDGTRVVTGSEDGTVRVWDARTGQLVAELRGHARPVTSIAVSWDGGRVVSGSEVEVVGPEGGLRFRIESRNGTVRVWDGRTGRGVCVCSGLIGPVSSVAVSWDGRVVVTGSMDGTACVWDGRTGQPVAELRGSAGPVWSVAVSGDGSRVVTGSIPRENDLNAAISGCVRVWDARTGQMILDGREHVDPVWSVAMSGDGGVIAAATVKGPARVWDGRTGKLVAELRGSAGSVRSVAVSGDGSRVVTGSGDGTARVWDARTGQVSFDLLGGYVSPVEQVAVSGDGGVVATLADYGTAHVWSGRNVGRFAILSDRFESTRVTAMAVSRDGSRVVTGSEDGTSRVWDGRTGQSLVKLGVKSRPVEGVGVSNDGRVVVTMSGPTALVWDGHTGQMLTQLDNPTTWMHSLALSGDGSRVVIAGMNPNVNWKAEYPRTTLKTGVSQGSDRADTSPFELLALVWDTRTGQRVAELRDPKGDWRVVAASGDGRRIVTLSSDDGRIWDTLTGRVVSELRGHSKPVTSIAVSWDGSQVVTGSNDGTIRVWDGGTGQAGSELRNPGGSVLSVAMTADGSQVVAGSEDGTFRVWDVRSGQAAAELRSHTGRIVFVSVPAGGCRMFTLDDAGWPTIWFATGSRGNSADCTRLATKSPPIDEDERLRRLWMTRPAPAWHRWRQEQLTNAGNTIGANIQRSFEAHAHGLLALEDGDFERAQGYFLQAALLRPSCPVSPEIAPPPRPRRP